MEAVVRKVKALRKEHGHTVKDMAEYLNIDEKQYLQFERGKSKKDISYYVLLRIAERYNVSVDYLLGSYSWRMKESELTLRSDIPNLSLLSDEQKKVFAQKVKNVEHMSRETFEKLNQNNAVTQYDYTDENEEAKSVALAANAPNEGELCFIFSEGRIMVSELMYRDNREYFEVGDRKYFIENDEVEILCKVLAQIDD